MSRRGVAVQPALAFGLIAILLDVWLGGPVKALDVWLAQWSIEETSALHGPANVLDRIGLRGVTVPILLVFVLWLRRRTGQWRPLWLAVFSVLAVNVAVGSLKLAVGRGRPSAAVPDLFVGDIMWPSGHAANIAMTTALLVYLVRTYGDRPIGRSVGLATVMVPSMLMTLVSVALGYHWLSDLLAGTIVGLHVAAGVTRWDAERVTARSVRWPRDFELTETSSRH